MLNVNKLMMCACCAMICLLAGCADVTRKIKIVDEEGNPIAKAMVLETELSMFPLFSYTCFSETDASGYVLLQHFDTGGFFYIGHEGFIPIEGFITASMEDISPCDTIEPGKTFATVKLFKLPIANNMGSAFSVDYNNFDTIYNGYNYSYANLDDKQQYYLSLRWMIYLTALEKNYNMRIDFMDLVSGLPLKQFHPDLSR